MRIECFSIRLLSRALCTLFLFPNAPLAQGQRGSISGTITDATGAVLTGVTVTVTNEETASTFKTVSEDNGGYLAPQLLPGFYRLQAEVQGFRQLRVERVQVNIDQAVLLDLRLEVGQDPFTLTITVEGEPPLVNTQSGSVGHVVQNRQIVDLPLNGRDAFDLVNLTPASFGIGGTISIAGGRTQAASALLDGVFNSRGGLGAEGIEIRPPIDSMQEFKVQASDMSAEFGRTSAGLVNAATKSGTNQFHGSAYEFLRNELFDSKGWGVDVKAPLKRNQFGATLGGPIRKDKTFFFYNYDGFRERRGVVRTRRVPTAEEQQGDFSLTRGDSGAILPIFDPHTGAPFPGNIIPASRQDSVARKVFDLKFIPLPNRPPDNPITQAGNWQQNSIDRTTRDFHMIRVDHDFSPNTKVFGRYILADPDDDLMGAAPDFGVADPDAFNVYNRRQNIALSLLHIFSPKLVTTLTAGGTRLSLIRRGLGFGQDIPAQLGLKGVQPDVFPRFNFPQGAVEMTSFGTPGSQNRTAAFTNTQYTGNLNWFQGNHNLKFGVEYWRFNANDLNRGLASGQFTFRASKTGLPLANFLLGEIDSVNVAFDAGIGKRSFYTAGYFQDDWKLHPRLTLNFGMRYEVESPVYEVANRMNNFDPQAMYPFAGQVIQVKGEDGKIKEFPVPAGTRGVVTFPGRNGYDKYLVNWDRNNVAPRFGLAWRPFDHNHTVVRAGYGIFYGSPYNRQVIQEMRLGFGAVFNRRTGFVDFPLREGLPPDALQFPSEKDLVPEFGSIKDEVPQQQIQFLDPERRTNYSQNFNLALAQQVKDFAFEFGYLGNLGRKVPFPNINLNHISPEVLLQTEPKATNDNRLLRPYPQYLDNTQIQILAPNWGLSNYHAFFVKSEKRFARGVGWLFSYTLSKWIDNVLFTGGDAVTFGDNDQIQNIYNIRGERALSTNDIRHRLVLSPIVELPFGRGKRCWQNGLLSQVFGDWSVSTIATLQSGSPFGVTVRDGARTYLGESADGKVLRPNLVSDPESHSKGKPAEAVRGIQWINPEAFALPAGFTHGNAARTVMTGPGRVNFDIAVLKNLHFTERYQLQFRLEMFNAFNTPYFSVPESVIQFDKQGAVLRDSSFGIASAIGSDRELQFALKFFF
jgi:hypothetical protein